MRRFVLLAFLLVACSRPTPPAPPADETPRAPVDDGLLRWSPGPVNDRSTVVVALHGMGDRPEAFAELFRDFRGDALFLFPRAPRAYGRGFSWFTFREGMTDADFAREVGAAEAALWETLAPRLAGRRVVVTGFSQGGILSFALAARHGEALACAVPVAGSLPGGLLPTAKTSPVFALHGTDDPVIPVVYARQTVNAFRALGGVAELEELAGVAHAVPGPLRALLYARVRACLR